MKHRQNLKVQWTEGRGHEKISFQKTYFLLIWKIPIMQKEFLNVHFINLSQFDGS